MSRYMWRKCNQNSKKRSRLDNSEHGESRKVPLTPAEIAKVYRRRKRLRGLDQPSTSTAALRNPDDETPMECSGSEATTPVECTGSENDVVMMDFAEISVVQPREDFDARWSRSNRYFDEAFLTNDFGQSCDVCDRIWFRKDKKSPTTDHVVVLRTEFDDPNLAEFSVSNTSRHSRQLGRRLLHGQLDYRPRNKIHTGSPLHPSQRATRINRILHVSNAWCLLWSH
jgi:hypothetical protein